jgi:hypothetical protein
MPISVPILVICKETSEIELASKPQYYGTTKFATEYTPPVGKALLFVPSLRSRNLSISGRLQHGPVLPWTEKEIGTKFPYFPGSLLQISRRLGH